MTIWLMSVIATRNDCRAVSGSKEFTVLRDRFERGEQRQGTLMKVHGELRGFHALWSTNKERVLVVLA